MQKRNDYSNLILNALLDKGVIDESLYEKCRKKEDYALTTSINNYVKKAFSDFADKYAFDKNKGKIEHSMSVSNNGSRLSFGDGDKNSVETYIDSAFENLLKEKCGDLISQFDKDNDLDSFTDGVIGRLGDGGIYHIHNHPSSFQGASPENPIATCLSEADCMNVMLNPVTYDGVLELYNVTKCQFAVCSNGTSMMLINNNPIGTSLGFNEKDFTRAVEHLSTEWRGYLHKTESEIKSRKKEIVAEKLKTIPPNLPAPLKKKMKTKINNEVKKEVYKEINKQNHDEFPKIAGYVVNEFKDLGFELKFDFSEVVIK